MKNHYSFTAITGISGNPSEYQSMLTDAYGQDGIWNPDLYIANRKKLEKWIIRGVGDALKYGYSKSWIGDRMAKIVRIFNHYPEPDSSSAYIETVIDYVRREARYHPYGLRWITVHPKTTITCWVQYRYAFNKDSDWRLYCALDLFTGLNPEEEWITIYTPADLDRTAAMDRSTRQRALTRLETAGWIRYDLPNRGRGIRFKICKRPKKRPPNSPGEVRRPSSDTAKGNWDSWYTLHQLLAGRPPSTWRHPEFPLIYVGEGDLQVRLGTVSIRQLVAACFSQPELDTAWKNLRSDSGSFRLHQQAREEVLKAPQRMPYPVDPGFFENPYIKQLIAYQEQVAFPAMDRGLPFDIEEAKRIKYRLFMAYYGHGRNPLDPNMSPVGTKTRIEILNRYIRLAGQASDGRIRPIWEMRGTQSDRVIMRQPAVQNLPKDLRFLLRNKEEALEWHDIKGQEIYITIMEAKSVRGQASIREKRDLMQEIADELDMEKKVVKGVIHPYQRGKGRRRLQAEHGTARVDSVIDAFQERIPEAAELKKRIEEYTRTHGGVLPRTPDGRRPITIDQERTTTRAGALRDQTIGGELNRGWALNYAQTGEGKRWPISLDMHDAIVLSVPRNEEERTRQQRRKAVAGALERAAAGQGYAMAPTAAADTPRPNGQGRIRVRRRNKPRGLVNYCCILGQVNPVSTNLIIDRRVFYPP